MNINHSFNRKEVQNTQNLDNFYIWGPRFVMSTTDAQNRVDIIFNIQKYELLIDVHIINLEHQYSGIVFKI